MKFNTIDDWWTYPELKEYARRWNNQPRPKYFRHQRKRKQCYFNAANAALDHPKLIYCEGIATFAEGNEAAMSHAWCLDIDGNVIDQTLTYDETRIYLGIPLSVPWLWFATRDTQAWGNTLWRLNKLFTDGQSEVAIQYIKTSLLDQFKPGTP